MYRFIITSLLILSSLIMRADDRLVLTKVTNEAHLHSLFENRDLTIHYYSDSFIIASLAEGKTMEQGSIVLDEKAFSDSEGYYIVYCPPSQLQSYLTEAQQAGKVLYSNDNFLFIKRLDNNSQLFPAKNDGMVHITQQRAYLPDKRFDYPVIIEPDSNISNFISQVSTPSVMSYTQSLEDFGTRRCNNPISINAQNWIKSKYESFGLSTYVHNVTGVYPWWGGGVVQSGNVISIQTGTEFPDEYLVLGGHYDSFAFSGGQEPGADDDATGTAGVMEVARILSQYDFKRSIIYCAFTAEECGLDGSNQFAQKCKNEGMNILGYFNLDMTGYLTPGSPIHFCLIYPNGALTLADYFVNICDVYFPSVPVTRHSNMPGGDSDHTSFNQKGYKGIWWFEDVNEDSPYIHTSNDKIGPSVNNPEQVKVFTQAMVASIATLALLDNEGPALPVVDFSASETTITEGTTIQFTDLSTNDPTQWHWFFEGGSPSESVEQHPAILYSTAGSYNVKLVATNAAGSAELLRENYITVKTPTLPPVADFTADVTEIEEGESVSFTDLSQNNPDTWQWHFAGGEPQQSGLKNPIILYPAEGLYSVSLTVTNEAGDNTAVKDNYIKVTPKTAISEKDKTSAITIYPNPTTGELIVTSYKLQVTGVEILDVFGRNIISKLKSQNSNQAFDLSNAPSGIYFIRIQTENEVIVRKVVKQ